jgi:hypothetical protein
VLQGSEHHQDLVTTDVQLHESQELPIGIDRETVAEGSSEEVVQTVQYLFDSKDELSELLQEKGAQRVDGALVRLIRQQMFVNGLLQPKTGDTFLEVFPIQIDMQEFPTHDDVPERYSLFHRLSRQQTIHSSIRRKGIVVAVGVEDGVVLEEVHPDFLVEDFYFTADGNENAPIFLFMREEMRNAFGAKNPAPVKRS